MQVWPIWMMRRGGGGLHVGQRHDLTHQNFGWDHSLSRRRGATCECITASFNAERKFPEGRDSRTDGEKKTSAAPATRARGAREQGQDAP
jgi:hypothetical protein